MKLLKISIQNFLTIGGLVTLNLSDRGLLLVQGKNEDSTSANSNGAGKSSLVDAISWVLYGETARGESTDSVINSAVGKDCCVTAYVELEPDKVLKVVRYRKCKEFGGSGLAVHLGAFDAHANFQVETGLTKGTDKLTQALLEDLLGCSKEVFNASVYLGQDNMPDLPKMTDTALKSLVEEAAGINRVAKAYDSVVDKRKAALMELTRSQSKADILTNQITGAAEAIARNEETIKSMLEEKAARVDAAKKAFDEQFAEFTKLLNGKSMEEWQAAKARLIALSKPTEEQTKKRAELAAVVDNATREIAAAHSTAVRDNHTVATISNQIRAAEKEITSYMDLVGKPCKECGKPHTAEEFEPFKKSKTEQINELKVRLGEAEFVLSKSKLAHAEAIRQEKEARMMLDGHAKLVSDSLAANADKAQRITEHLGRLSVAQNSVDKAAIAIKEIEKSKPEAAVLKQNDDLRKVTEARTAELEEQKKVIEAQQRDLRAINLAEKALGRAGVRAHILDTVTPMLNIRTNHYLGTLSDGEISAEWTTVSTTAKGELREKFAINVQGQAADRFGLLSGGEKRKVRLATALALQDLVASRAVKPFKLFVADEIDEALDESGLERLMSVLHEKAKDRGTVMVISHNSLTNWIDEVITVRKKGKMSQVEGALA